MKRKNIIARNNRRAIQRALPRFISLLVMAFLGMFAFVGLTSTAPDMITTLEKYMDDNNVYDLRLVSTMGFTEDDVKYIAHFDGIYEVAGSKSVDAVVQEKETEPVIQIISMPDNINRIKLLEGRFPMNNREIVVEENYLQKEESHIGDKIVFSDIKLTNCEFTIVGVVESPLFFNNVSINANRGNTSVGSGKINYYAYCEKSAFSFDAYTEIYATADKAMVNDIKSNIAIPGAYVYDRMNASVYSDYIDDSNTIRNLAKIFPVVFFGVAVLISLISMSRLVDDDRLEIGTLKSLGFSNAHIISKYFTFSLWATIVGSVMGAALGLFIIPTLINYIYKIIFDLPKLVYTVQPLYIGIGFGITVVCICGSSVLTALMALRLKPSVLMRPKPPKAGHRILLERISFIWKRLRFSKKVTIRNLFRFKGKAFITIGGIAGCTALILTGFGIKDSIVDMPTIQYHDIFQYDGTALLSKLAMDSDVRSEIMKIDGITGATYAQRVTCEFEDLEGYVLVIDKDDLKNIAEFKSYKTGELVELETGKGIISEKMATILGKKVGDTIEFVDLKHETYSVEISAVVTNLIEHFVYVDIETYASLGGTYMPNLLYFNMDKNTDVKQIIDAEGVMSVSLREDHISSLRDTLKSLDLVVWILIVLSALLAFVVLYNLSNINISERKREIATLKVLGFYDKEVDDYIIKETMILSALGVFIGLFVGKFLSHIVVLTVEVEKCRFVNKIKPLSYLYSAIITLLFVTIVSAITHYKLKKVNMIDSLKSVE